jgi:hypothetical protein
MTSLGAATSYPADVVLVRASYYQVDVSGRVTRHFQQPFKPNLASLVPTWICGLQFHILTRRRATDFGSDTLSSL